MTYSLLDLGLILTIFSRILSAPHRPTPAVCRVPSSSLRPHAFRLRNYACDPMLWMRHVLIFYIFFDESIYRALLIFKYVYVCFGGFLNVFRSTTTASSRTDDFHSTATCPRSGRLLRSPSVRANMDLSGDRGGGHPTHLCTSRNRG